MYQMVYEFHGKTEHRNYDVEKDFGKTYEQYKLLGWNPIVYHTSAPVKPSIVPLPTHGGYCRDLKEETREVVSSRIVCDEFVMKFERRSKITIDPFCDALNGWYTVWLDTVTITLTTKTGAWKIRRPLEEADKVFEKYFALANKTK